jgi:hypothetical protein
MSVILSAVDRFDQLVTTPAARDALRLLRSATGRIDGPMELHCLRVHHIALELAGRRGWAFDTEVLVVASILHDVGLYPSASRGGVYTEDGAELARELLHRHGWSDDRVDRCADAIDRHHDLRHQLARGSEVEAVRLADLIDLGGGLLTCGLDRQWLRALARTVPRRGLAGELAREVGRALRQRPLTLLQIFRRP